MMKSKRLLSTLLTFLMVFSLVVIPQSVFAAANWTQFFDMSAMMGSSAYGRHGTTTTTDYGVAGVYGKSDTVLKLGAYDENGKTDYYLGLGNSTAFPFSASSTTVISYDVAFDKFYDADSNHYALLQFANTSGSNIGTFNFLQVGRNGSLIVLDQTTTLSLKEKVWNNITAVIELGEDSKSCSCTVYVNGKSAKSVTKTFSSDVGYFRALRICDRSYASGSTAATAVDGGLVYIDNLYCASYPAADNATVSFSVASTKTDASLVDTTKNKITLGVSNLDMTVEAFNAKDDGFIFLKDDGTVAALTDKIADCNAYAVMTNDTNSYYVPYTVEYPTPVITGTSDRTKAIIDSTAKTISLVDNQYLTVGEFKEETTGAKIMSGDDAATDDALLSGCTVYATLGDAYSEFDEEYTLTYSREYYIDNETFDGTFIASTTSNGKTLYTTSDNVNFLMYGQGIASGLTYGQYVDKDGNNALAMTAESIAAAGVPFILINNPYTPTKNADVAATHTLEFKILANGAADYDLSIGNKTAFTLYGDGTAKAGNNSTVIDNWDKDTWIPVAITYYKATNRMEVYVNGEGVFTNWGAGQPGTTDIRFRGYYDAGESGALAIDDVSLHTGGIEEYVITYYTDDVETADKSKANKIKVVSTDKLNYIPVLAKYQGGELVAISVGSDKTAEMAIGDASEVKFFYWNALSQAIPFEKSKTVYSSDGVNPVTAYNATLSNAFGDGMVLQRGEEIKVWGTANDADYSALTVALGDEKKTAYVLDGEWEVSFDAMEANSDGIDLTVTTLGSTTTVNDILIGDVYVIGGQSNAALPLSVTSEYSNAEMRSFDGNVRMLYQPRNSDACISPRKTLIDGCEWGIVEFDKGSAYAATTLPRYSALGIYFGEYLADGLKAANMDVPVGVIEATLGGTSLFEHLNAENFAKHNPDYLDYNTKASRIYNKNIAPIEKFAVNGIIWYQGENESIGSIIDKTTLIYDDMFADYLTQYRQTDNFNAFVVQLSSHTTNAHNDGTTGWNVPRMRAYQYDMAKNGGYYIIPSLDHGVKTAEYDASSDKSDTAAHPKYKKPIGKRAANAVLSVIYGQDSAMAPVYDTITYAEDKVTITFANVGTGLTLAVGEELLGFELIKDGVATSATATITSANTVEISGVAGATGVRYAFYRSAPKTIANLVNSQGVACPTFVHSNDSTNVAAIAPISTGAME